MLNSTTVALLIGLEAAGVVLLGGMFTIAIVAYRRANKKVEEYKKKSEAYKAELAKFMKAIGDLA